MAAGFGASQDNVPLLSGRDYGVLEHGVTLADDLGQGNCPPAVRPVGAHVNDHVLDGLASVVSRLAEVPDRTPATAR